MSSGATKHFPQRDYKGRCVECGRAHAPRKYKRIEVVATAIAIGADERYVDAKACYSNAQLAARYRAVILPRSLRVQVLAPLSDYNDGERFKDRWCWRDVQRIPREHQAPSKLSLWATLNEFERAIVTGALGRRVRDAARACATDANAPTYTIGEVRVSPMPALFTESALMPGIKVKISWWARLFTFTPWLLVEGGYQ